jgi:adenylate cyclase
MIELIAQGADSGERWHRPLVEGVTIRLGRAPDAGWSVAWDNQISREHAELTWRGGRLKVRRLEAARNPIFFHGKVETEFTVEPNEFFVIGSTTFFVQGGASDAASVSLELPALREQHTFRPGDLRQIQFRDADQRLEVLAHWPELIAESTSDEVFLSRLVSLLLAGIPHAEAAAVVCRIGAPPLTPPRSRGTREAVCGADDASRRVEVLQWDRRRDAVGRFQPSQRLIVDALTRGDSVLHVWSGSGASDAAFTMTENLDWAFCTPVPGDACRGWGLYVAGCFSTPRAESAGAVPGAAAGVHDLKGDLRFAELVAELFGAVRQVRQLERQQAGLRQFFAPAVLDTILKDDADAALEPRETDATVLFCDLRGFAREAEQWRENPRGLLTRVSDALGVMTRHILGHGGVIGDFQGDAAMGFWGWPIAAPDGPLDAARAALAIDAEFQQAARESGHSLANFEVGIGIAHGRAVAGKIGTAEHVEVTVFGPVVNLASRLESMTKHLRVSILLDEASADVVRRRLSAAEGRTRRLGRVRPFGLETSLMATELLPPAAVDPTLSDDDLRNYEAAVDALLAGRWSEALELLHKLPAKDRARDFLTIFVAQHHYAPPPGWNGVICMPSK